MNALEVLVAARAKITNPEDWGKGRRGRRDCDRPLHTCCAAEAIEDISPSLDKETHSERRRAFRALMNAAGLDNRWNAIINWNDAPERTHAEVLAAYDLAIATLSLGARKPSGLMGDRPTGKREGAPS